MYDLYLGSMLMPVTPEKIKTSITGKNQTITLLNGGEINLLKSAGLTEIQFTLLIPQVRYPFARYGGAGFVSADAYLDYFEQLKTAKAPFQFILSRCMPTGKLLFDTNMTVALEDYTITEDAKNGFDLEVDIRLKQYRHYATKTISVDIPSPTAPIIVNENRPIVSNASSGSSSGGSSGSSSKGSSGSGGAVMKAYKVQVVGMDVVTVQASSPEEAILKAVGTSWKGTVYVDSLAYSGETRKRITSSSSSSSAIKSSTASTSIKTVVKTASQVANAVSALVSKVTQSVGKKTTTVSKKTASSSSAVKSTAKSGGGTKFAVVAKN